MLTYLQTGWSQRKPSHPGSQTQVWGWSTHLPWMQPRMAMHSVQFGPDQPSWHLWSEIEIKLNFCVYVNKFFFEVLKYVSYLDSLVQCYSLVYFLFAKPFYFFIRNQATFPSSSFELRTHVLLYLKATDFQNKKILWIWKKIWILVLNAFLFKEKKTKILTHKHWAPHNNRWYSQSN
jgi:hypothetical protein